MSLRRVLFAASVVSAIVLSLMPVISSDRDLGVQQHHLDHAVLMFLGIAAGLALAGRTVDREAAPWLWLAVLCPLVAMVMMAPSLYAVVDTAPWLHALDHVALVFLAALCAYAGQRYVRGVGWASALLLESMAITAAFGYGVAPAAANLPESPPPQRQASAPVDIAHGGRIFVQDCAACHGAHGEGGVGPSLRGEATRKSFPAVVAWIKKPAAPMPALYPGSLSAADVADVAAFVETLK